MERLAGEVEKGEYLLHGSNQFRLTHLRPRMSTDVDGTRKVYATTDPLTAFFFAVVQKANVKQFCLSYDTIGDFHCRIEPVNVDLPAFGRGTIYVVLRRDFSLNVEASQIQDGDILAPVKQKPPEWCSTVAVPVLKSIVVPKFSFLR